MAEEICLIPLHREMAEHLIRRAERICPGALQPFGVYGSAAAGDMHSKSDLDLLILIGDDRGWRMADVFILDDVGVGYDLYCTNWEGLQDAACTHANLATLLAECCLAESMGKTRGYAAAAAL